MYGTNDDETPLASSHDEERASATPDADPLGTSSGTKRAWVFVSCALGSALVGTAALTSMSKEQQPAATTVVSAKAGELLTLKVPKSNLGWEELDASNKLNSDSPRADMVLSLRELAQNSAKIKYMGAAVTYSDLMYTEGYAGNHTYHYNLLTASNECKWVNIWKYDYSECDYIVDYAAESDQAFRFHTLVWLAGGVPTNLQDAYDAGNLTRKDKVAILNDHVTNTTQRYKGKVYAYDVINEAVCDFGYLCYPNNGCSDYTEQHVTDRGVWRNDTSGCVFSEYYGVWLKSSIWLDGNHTTDYTEFIDDAFRVASYNDPNALMCYNDYKYESEETFETQKSEQVFKLLQGMKDRGVPINCIGQQTHIDITYVNRTHWAPGYKENLKRLATLGTGDDPVSLMITEFDAKCSDDHADLPCEHWGESKEAAQAELYKEGIDFCLSNDNCVSFESWGWTDLVDFAASDDEYGDRHPFPFDSNYRAKPAYYALAERLQATVMQPGNTTDDDKGPPELSR